MKAAGGGSDFPSPSRKKKGKNKKEEKNKNTHLVRQQQADRLEALLPAVHVVPKEQVVSLRREPPVLEQPQQVRVLPVHVAADLDRRLELEEVRLAHQDLPRGDAEGADLGLGEGDGAAGPAGAGVDEALDDRVEGGVLEEKDSFFFREREISFFLPSEREVEVSSFSSPPFFRPSKGDERLGAARRLGRGASLRFSLSAIEQI